jgi:hypothetical protein
MRCIFSVDGLFLVLREFCVFYEYTWNIQKKEQRKNTLLYQARLHALSCYNKQLQQDSA